MGCCCKCCSKCWSCKNFLEVLLHLVLLWSPIFAVCVFSNSDNIWKHVPSSLDASENITNVGFGLEYFKVDGADHVEFSDQQEDVFGSTEYKLAKNLHSFFTSIMWVAVLIPILVYWIRCCCKKWNRLRNTASLARIYSYFIIPILVAGVFLNIIPLVLMTRTALCGPNYMELGYEEIDQGECGPELVGTFAKVHEDVSASCKLGRRGISNSIFLGFLTIALVLQAAYLRAKASKLQALYEEEEQNEAFTEAKVTDIETASAKTDTSSQESFELADVVASAKR